jgi:hypothetical protein
MRVNTDSGPLEMSKPRHHRAAAKPPARGTRADLSATQTPHQALGQLPASRTQRVARAKALVADLTYPSPTVLQAVATRLSRHLMGEKP